jgi:hypothetical protein
MHASRTGMHQSVHGAERDGIFGEGLSDVKSDRLSYTLL